MRPCTLSQPLAPVHLTHHSPPFQNGGEWIGRLFIITVSSPPPPTTTPCSLYIDVHILCSHALWKLGFANWSLKHWEPFVVWIFHLKLIDLGKDQHFSSSSVNVIHIPKSSPWHVDTCVVQCIAHLEVAELLWKYWVFVTLGVCVNFIGLCLRGFSDLCLLVFQILQLWLSGF